MAGVEVRPRTAVVHRALLAADYFAAVVAVALAIFIASPDDRVMAHVGWTLLYAPVFLLLFKVYGLYDGDRKRLGHATLDEVPGSFHASLLGTLGLWGFFKLVPVPGLVFAEAACCWCS
jgi:hypothetical protein